MTAAVSYQNPVERKRLIAQWLRHVEKMRAQFSAPSHTQGRYLRLVMEAADVSRFVTVTDGDGIVFAGLRVRIHGMDAPEIEQTCTDAEGRPWPCGREAWRALRRLLKCRRLEVEVLGIDVYGRMIARLLADGRDVAATMIAGGWAVARDDKAYGHLEQQAARQKRGIWRGAFEDPESWRRNGSQSPGQEQPRPRQPGKTDSRITTAPAPPKARSRPPSPPGGDAILRIQRMLDEVERSLDRIFEKLKPKRH